MRGLIVTVLACAPLLSGCVVMDGFAPRASAPRTAALPGLMEPIHAAAIAQNQAVFWVSSNGCTAKADLTPVVRRVGDGSTITLRRIKEDPCERPMAEGVEMRWSFEEMGLAPGARVSVENPYQAPIG